MKSPKGVRSQRPDPSRPDAGEEISTTAKSEIVPSAPSSTARELARLDLQDLDERIDRERRAARRHTMWALLGVSPGALIPMLVTLGEAGWTALITGVVAMTGLEAWRAARADRKANRLEEMREALLEGPADQLGPADEPRPADIPVRTDALESSNPRSSALPRPSAVEPNRDGVQGPGGG